MNDMFSERMNNLLEESQAIDQSKHYVNFYNIWQNPQKIKECSEILVDYIQEKNSVKSYYAENNTQNLVLLSPDNVGGNLGIIPVTFLMAKTLKCKIAIWKEFANIEWGTSSLVGPSEEGLKCIVIQDVVDEGTTALRIAPHIKKLNWDFVAYLAAVLNSPKKDSGVEKNLTKLSDVFGKKPDFYYVTQII